MAAKSVFIASSEQGERTHWRSCCAADLQRRSNKHKLACAADREFFHVESLDNVNSLLHQQMHVNWKVFCRSGFIGQRVGTRCKNPVRTKPSSGVDARSWRRRGGHASRIVPISRPSRTDQRDVA